MVKTCNNCSTTEKKTPSTVPYQVFVDFKDTAKSTVQKLWIAVMILIFLLVGTNIAWLIYESQLEDVVTTEEIIIDAGENGVANYIGNDGEVYNGENHS